MPDQAQPEKGIWAHRHVGPEVRKWLGAMCAGQLVTGRLNFTFLAVKETKQVREANTVDLKSYNCLFFICLFIF